MSEIKMKQLRDLLVRMDNKEVSNLYDYLKAFHSKFGEYTPRSLLVVKLLLKKREITYDDLKARSNPEMSENTFSVFIWRLYQKALITLPLEVNIPNKDKYPVFWQAKFELRQKLSVADILFGKGLTRQGTKLINSILKKALKYEQYSIYLEAARVKLNVYAPKGKTNEMEELVKEIDYIQRLFDFYNEVYLFFNRTTAIEEWKLHPNLKDEAELALKSFIEKKEHFPKHSYNVDYFIALIQLNFLEANAEHEAALSVASNTLNCVNEQEAIFSKRRLGSLLLHKIHNQLSARMYKDSIASIQECYNYNDPNKSNNGQLLVQYHFFALYYSKDYPSAYNLIQSLIGKTDKEEYPIRYSKRVYFRACLQFLRGHFKHSLSDLSATVELDSDREGWNLNIRILTTLNLIELEKFDEADREVTNLYQLLNTLKKGTTIQPRYMEFFNLLSNLKKNAYDFQKTGNQMVGLLENLAKTDEMQPINLTPELISVEKWFYSKFDSTFTSSLAIEFNAA